MSLLRRSIQFLADRPILAKLILSLFIMVTPLYAFNYIINDSAANKNRMEIERALINSLHSYNNIFDGEFRRMKQLLDTKALDIAISHVNVMKPDISPTEKTTFFNAIRANLNQIQFSTLFISDTEAYLPMMDAILSVTDPFIREFDSTPYAALNMPSKKIVSLDGQLYVSTPFVTNNPGDQQSLFILTARLSKEIISSYLSKIMSFKRGGSILFGLQDDWEIATRTTDPITAEIKLRLAAYTALHKLGPYSAPQSIVERIHGENYLIVFEQSAASSGILASYAPESEIYESLSIYHFFFYTMSILSVLTIVLFSLSLYKLIHKPLRALVQGFRKVEFGQLKFALAHKNKDEFGYLYNRFNTMISTLDNMVNVVYEQKLLNERSELKRLQAQINPHFLYNNFFVLQRLIRSDQRDKAAQFSEYLGRYFQFVTRQASDEITLEEDVLHARTYVDIQSVCFDHRLKVHFEPTPPELAPVLIPRLILQPVLENSFNHAFEKQLGEGSLSVSFMTDDRFIQIIVEDNGKQLDDSQLDLLSNKLASVDNLNSESTGIINVHLRLRLKFGDHSGLILSRSPLGGLKTQIMIEKKEVSFHDKAVDR